jgi:hypothetical protein
MPYMLYNNECMAMEAVCACGPVNATRMQGPPMYFDGLHTLSRHQLQTSLYWTIINKFEMPRIGMLPSIGTGRAVLIVHLAV